MRGLVISGKIWLKSPGCLAQGREILSGKLDFWLQTYEDLSWEREFRLILCDSNEQSKIMGRKKLVQHKEAFVEV